MLTHLETSSEGTIRSRLKGRYKWFIAFDLHLNSGQATIAGLFGVAVDLRDKVPSNSDAENQ